MGERVTMCSRVGASACKGRRVQDETASVGKGFGAWRKDDAVEDLGASVGPLHWPILNAPSILVLKGPLRTLHQRASALRHSPPLFINYPHSRPSPAPPPSYDEERPITEQLTCLKVSRMFTRNTGTHQHQLRYALNEVRGSGFSAFHRFQVHRFRFTDSQVVTHAGTHQHQRQH